MTCGAENSTARADHGRGPLRVLSWLSPGERAPPPVLIGHVSSLPPVLTGRVSSGAPYVSFRGCPQARAPAAAAAAAAAAAHRAPSPAPTSGSPHPRSPRKLSTVVIDFSRAPHKPFTFITSFKAGPAPAALWRSGRWSRFSSGRCRRTAPGSALPKKWIDLFLLQMWTIWPLNPQPPPPPAPLGDTPARRVSTRLHAQPQRGLSAGRRVPAPPLPFPLL